MDLDKIPQHKKVNFPAGVSEHEYETRKEIDAFLEGVNLAQDTDVETGEIFQRDGNYVVRVRVGEWPEED